MNDAKLYYTPPSNAAFEEMKKAAMEIWDGMGNAGGYRDSKIARIKDIANVKDNFMYILAMFDAGNQHKCAMLLSPETKEEVRIRMLDGGNPEFFTNMILGL